MRRMVYAAILLAALAGGPVAAESTTELEQEQTRLDARLLELQADLYRARRNQDDGKQKELTVEWDKVQKRRIEILQRLGHLPR
jgi:hypothetical protein